jgi:hypothetical protein
VIKSDASIKTQHGQTGRVFNVTLAIFVHFDGGGGSTGASIGYDHDSDQPAAEAWKQIYSHYWPFKWMSDNYTDAEHYYYGFAHSITSDAELLVELGDMESPEQAQWLKPRLEWLGSLLAYFASHRVGKGGIVDPGPYRGG